jgi:hypothetical protein
VRPSSLRLVPGALTAIEGDMGEVDDRSFFSHSSFHWDLRLVKRVTEMEMWVVAAPARGANDNTSAILDIRTVVRVILMVNSRSFSLRRRSLADDAHISTVSRTDKRLSRCPSVVTLRVIFRDRAGIRSNRDGAIYL